MNQDPTLEELKHMSPEKPMEALLKIGHHDKDTMDAFSAHMAAILTCQAGDEVKIAALKALAESLPVRNVTVEHCTFDGCCCEGAKAEVADMTLKGNTFTRKEDE